MASNKVNCGVFILGMHRSGTSALAGSLRERGLKFGDVDVSNSYNPKGNVESSVVNFINETILKFNGGRWDNPPMDLHSNALHNELIKLVLNSFDDDHIFGVKDPRLIFTINHWIKHLVNYQLIGIFRNPHEVSLSLKTRNKFSVKKGLELWMRYNNQLYTLCQTHSIKLIEFSNDVKFKEDIVTLGTMLGLNVVKKFDYYDNSKINTLEQPEIGGREMKIYNKLKEFSLDNCK